jgi:hypothetical protein
MPTSLVDICCNLFKCTPRELKTMFRRPEYYWPLWLYFKIDECGQFWIPHLRKFVTFDGFSRYPSDRQFAYNGFQRTTVVQHFYSRHGIRVKYPKLPCIKVKRGLRKRGGYHYDYFPLELVLYYSHDELSTTSLHRTNRR